VLKNNMLKRENLSDKLTQIIGRKIILNELKSGEIIVETQISREFGTSRSPVKDALHRLEKKNLVEKDERGRYQVPKMSPEYIENVYDTINTLYQYTFTRATKRVTKDNLKHLSFVVEKIENSITDKNFDIYIEGVSNFGEKILQISQNPIIEQIALDLMPTAERIQYIAIKIAPSHLKKTGITLKKIYKYLLEKNPKKAAAAFKDFTDVSKIILINKFADDKKTFD
jgi:DNA-binding GntR family transcriptional regulator